MRTSVSAPDSGIHALVVDPEASMLLATFRLALCGIPAASMLASMLAPDGYLRITGPRPSFSTDHPLAPLTFASHANPGLISHSRPDRPLTVPTGAGKAILGVCLPCVYGEARF